MRSQFQTFVNDHKGLIKKLTQKPVKMANIIKGAIKSSYLANDRHRNLFYQLLKATVMQNITVAKVEGRKWRQCFEMISRQAKSCILPWRTARAPWLARALLQELRWNLWWPQVLLPFLSYHHPGATYRGGQPSQLPLFWHFVLIPSKPGLFLSKPEESLGSSKVAQESWRCSEVSDGPCPSCTRCHVHTRVTTLALSCWFNFCSS